MTQNSLKVVGIRAASGSAVVDACNGTPAASENDYDERCEFIDQLFRRYRYSLLRYLHRLTGDTGEAEDVIQETYLRLIRAENLDRLESKARNYIFTIATNLVRDRRRYDRARSRDQHVSTETADLASLLPLPEQVFDQKVLLSIVKQCLLELPDRGQRVFILHIVERLTYREIADILNVSSKTVERDFALAMELCRLRLKEACR